MSKYKGDNSGGYGNPPIDHQFKKKGPPGPGRPKGSTSMDAALKKVFRSKVPYKENGKPVSGEATDALSKRLLQHGLAGPHRATLAVIDLARKHGPQELEPDETPLILLDALSDDELKELGRLMEKATGNPGWNPKPDHPLAKYADPSDPDNYYTEQTVDGLRYRHCRVPSVDSVLTGIANRAYFSAALPKRVGCYRRR